MVRSISILSAGGNVLFGLVARYGRGFSEGGRRHRRFGVEGLAREKGRFDRSASRTAETGDGKGKFPAERFFNEKKCWNRLEVRNEKGGEAGALHSQVHPEHLSADFCPDGRGKRNRFCSGSGRRQMERFSLPGGRSVFSRGRRRRTTARTSGGKGVFVYPENATLRQTRTVPDEDSFYNSAEAMNAEAPEWIISLELTEPKAYKIYAYSRSPENFTNHVFLSVDNGGKPSKSGEISIFLRVSTGAAENGFS